MAKVATRTPHLVCRGGRFYFRMRVPVDLVEHWGATEVSKALGDLSKPQAAARAKELASELAGQFLAKRHSLGLGPEPVPVNLPEARRDEIAGFAVAYAEGLTATDREVRSVGGREDLYHWTGQLQDLDAATRRTISGDDRSGLWADFYADLKANGRRRPRDPEEARRQLYEWAEIVAQGIAAAGARAEGIPAAPPRTVGAVRAPAGDGTAARMADALRLWEAARTRPEKTVEAFRRHAQMFVELMDDPPLQSLRRLDAVRFRDRLQAWAKSEGKTASTADNVLTTIKALANIARDHEWIDGLIFDRLSVKDGGKEGTRREPWTGEDLQRLFSTALFTAYELPAGSAMARKAGADAAYWVPLLAAYTGARVSELCQLWTDDISQGSGGLVIEFRDNKARQQTLKTAGSWRAVPVHSELIRLGFAEYWAAVSASEGQPGPLFPALRTAGKNGAGGQFGQWFGHYKTRLGFATPAKTMHSFRHTFETQLGRLGVSPTVVDALTGHVGQGTGRKVYAATIRENAEPLRTHLERLRYPALDLPRVYHSRSDGKQ